MNVDEWNKLVMDNLNYNQLESGFTSDDTNTTLILNAIEQTRLMKELLAEQKKILADQQHGMKSIEVMIHNQLAHFMREFPEWLRRSK